MKIMSSGVLLVSSLLVLCGTSFAVGSCASSHRENVRAVCVKNMAGPKDAMDAAEARCDAECLREDFYVWDNKYSAWTLPGESHSFPNSTCGAVVVVTGSPRTYASIGRTEDEASSNALAACGQEESRSGNSRDKCTVIAKACDTLPVPPPSER
jgi:hypothetical protein